MKEFIKSIGFLRRLYFRGWLLRGVRGQSDETAALVRLARLVEAPKTFIEFGFHPTEFNCALIAKDPEWSGLLIDGNRYWVEDARVFLPKRIEAIQKFLTLDNLGFIKTRFQQLGVLSIDVDGNDYWFLEQLIDCGPSVICVEYNASFGLEPITVPYDEHFDRKAKHPREWYHGASLTALAKLCAAHGYGLAYVSEAGLNAFFTRRGPHLDPATAWRPSALRAQYTGVDHDGQWQSLRDMPFVRV
jgi:hypothetical protein